MVRLLVCEDDPRFRSVLVRTLEAIDGFEVEQVGSGERACERALDSDSDAVDLLLLDLELPGIGGIEVVRRVKPRRPELEILILTSFASEDDVFEAIRAGAAGYLVKGLALPKLVGAIHEVLAGGSVIDVRLSRRFWNLLASQKGQGSHDYGLTLEEVEVLTLVARGLSNPEAAEALGSSRRMVRTQLSSIYRKLDVSSRVEASVKAIQVGLIEL